MVDHVSHSAANSGSELVQALGELSSLMLATEDLEKMLSRVAGLAAASIGVPTSCGITLEPDGRPITAATSDQRASEFDELQYHVGQGPCLQTMHSGRVVSVPDLTVETRWGTYPAHVVAAGVRSSLSLPLFADSRPVGALNLYAWDVRVFTPARERDATVFAAARPGRSPSPCACPARSS